MRPGAAAAVLRLVADMMELEQHAHVTGACVIVGAFEVKITMYGHRAGASVECVAVVDLFEVSAEMHAGATFARYLDAGSECLRHRLRT